MTASFYTIYRNGHRPNSKFCVERNVLYLIWSVDTLCRLHYQCGAICCQHQTSALVGVVCGDCWWSSSCSWRPACGWLTLATSDSVRRSRCVVDVLASVDLVLSIYYKASAGAPTANDPLTVRTSLAVFARSLHSFICAAVHCSTHGSTCRPASNHLFLVVMLLIHQSVTALKKQYSLFSAFFFDCFVYSVGISNKLGIMEYNLLDLVCYLQLTRIIHRSLTALSRILLLRPLYLELNPARVVCFSGVDAQHVIITFANIAEVMWSVYGKNREME